MDVYNGRISLSIEEDSIGQVEVILTLLLPYLFRNAMCFFQLLLDITKNLIKYFGYY